MKQLATAIFAASILASTASAQTTPDSSSHSTAPSDVRGGGNGGSVKFKIFAGTSSNPNNTLTSANANAGSESNQELGNSLVNSWAFNKEGKRLWACAVNAVQVSNRMAQSFSSTDTLKNVDGKKVATRSVSLEGRSGAIIQETSAIYSPASDSFIFSSSVTWPDKNSNKVSSEVKISFDKKRLVLEERPIVGTSQTYQKQNTQIAIASFKKCAHSYDPK